MLSQTAAISGTGLPGPGVLSTDLLIFNAFVYHEIAQSPQETMRTFQSGHILEQEALQLFLWLVLNLLPASFLCYLPLHVYEKDHFVLRNQSMPRKHV